MGFYEDLEQRARLRLIREGGYPVDGVDATIFVLKEMTVGEPIPTRLEHEDMGPKTSTFLVDMNDEVHARWDGYKGIDGEEVVVMVFGHKHKSERAKRPYEPSEADHRRVISWQYCPYCLAVDHEIATINESGIEGNRFAYYMGGGNVFKCSWCGQIFKKMEEGVSKATMPETRVRLSDIFISEEDFWERMKKVVEEAVWSQCGRVK